MYQMQLEPSKTVLTCTAAPEMQVEPAKTILTCTAAPKMQLKSKTAPVPHRDRRSFICTITSMQLAEIHQVLQNDHYLNVTLLLQMPSGDFAVIDRLKINCSYQTLRCAPGTVS